MKEKVSKEYVRATFPASVAIAERFRGVFGPGVKLIYAAENGRELGRLSEPGRPSVKLSDTCISGSLYNDEDNKRGKRRK